jgi:ABC-type polysaccharide/polyol phosphate export permease
MAMCTNALIANSALINQVYFPKEIFHVSIAGYQLYRLVMSLLVIIPMMIWYQIMPTIHLLLLIPAILGISMLAIGFGMIASIVQVRIRDVSQLVNVLLRAGFFISGVFYGAEHVPEKWLHIHLLNPIAVYIEVSRVAVLGDMGVIGFNHILYALVISLLFMLIGMGIFKSFESRMVKYL